jgi:hypothetical protein
MSDNETGKAIESAGMFAGSPIVGAAAPVGLRLALAVADAWSHATASEKARLKAVLTAAAVEITARVEQGDRPRQDLVDRSYVRASELMEGTVLKAQQEYESRKHAHLGYLLVQVLFDPAVELEAAFQQLNLAERLTYRQYVLLALFDRRSADRANRLRLSETALGDDVEPDKGALMLQIAELFELGLLREEIAGAGDDGQATVGGLNQRYGVRGISFTTPAEVRLSRSGLQLARSLGLHQVPDDEVQAVAEPLR